MNNVNHILLKSIFHLGKEISFLFEINEMIILFMNSLHSNSPLDTSVKGAMICDLMNLSEFMIPDRRDILYEGLARR